MDSSTKMPPGHELLVMPRNGDEIEAAKARSRRRLTRTAAVASAASIIPLPGIDIAVDAAALIYKAIMAVGGAMIGKLITRELVIEALKAVGVRLTVKQAAKYVPLAGQALSVVIGFAAMQYVGRQHIRECARVVELVREVR